MPNHPVFQWNPTYSALPSHLYSQCILDKIPLPTKVLVNYSLAEKLGLPLHHLTDTEQSALLCGQPPTLTAPATALAYAGHQFGYYTTLGDGRAHLLGEHLTPDGRRVDIQLKGSGKTPYSRDGDGKATLGPMLREYLISEAMHYLGIPTTRSLAVTRTGEYIQRHTTLPGAILTRVASSHLRIGTFEFAARLADKQAITQLLHYTIKRHYPEIIDHPNPALALLDAVMNRQIKLVVDWLRVGFIHGVMNTDNITLSGETLDYGPCAFMDDYNPDTVFSSIDHQGRYAYKNQPLAAKWGIARLAETLLPCLAKDPSTAGRLATELIEQFEKRYQIAWLAMMRKKIGLIDQQADDKQLIHDLLDWMHATKADYTYTFYQLSHVQALNHPPYTDACFLFWHQRWCRRVRHSGKAGQRSHIMQQVNPTIIPRNHLIEETLTQAISGNNRPLDPLLSALKTPYIDNDNTRPFQTPPTTDQQIKQTFCGT